MLILSTTWIYKEASDMALPYDGYEINYYNCYESEYYRKKAENVLKLYH